MIVILSSSSWSPLLQNELSRFLERIGNIEGVPAFSMNEHEKSLTSSTGAVKVQTQVNKNLIDFYYDYPQCCLLYTSRCV